MKKTIIEYSLFDDDITIEILPAKELKKSRFKKVKNDFQYISDEVMPINSEEIKEPEEIIITDADREYYFEYYHNHKSNLLFQYITPKRLIQIKELIVGATWFDDIIYSQKSLYKKNKEDKNLIIDKFYHHCQDILKAEKIV